MIHISQIISVIKEKYPELGAKIGHDIDNISTY
jgi:hypothetical protein